MEDEALTDRSTLLMSALQFVFYEDNSRFVQLCGREFDGMEEIGRILNNWINDITSKLETRFDFIEGMRPYTPTDMINMGDTFLIEMTYIPEED